MIRRIVWYSLALLSIVCIGCTGKSSTGTQDVQRPMFTSDSAYRYIVAQVGMGPRVPGTRAHTECLLFLMQQMERFGAVVECQHGTIQNYNGEQQQVINIIAHYGDPTQKGRLLLGAHYDSRPWCDEEEDYSQRFVAVPGANDGASGVGVLMEVGRQLGILQQDTTVKIHPIDIIFFDCEDMGTPSFYTGVERQDTWCLGSQLWANTLTNSNSYQYGVILDMVGAPDAVFPKEYHSLQYAKDYVEKTWRIAGQLGHGRYFSHETVYPITDDHYYINTIAHIPTLDIIHYTANGGTGFAPWWHTQNDNMTHISKETLQAVGEVVMSLTKN